MVFFLPLSLYCFYLAALNRSPRAVILSGVWDVVGVLGALSGFLLFGGPAILSGLYEQWRISWLLGNFERLREIRGDWHGWIMLFGAYFVAVLTFASWFIMQAQSYVNLQCRSASIRIGAAQCPGRIGYRLETRGLANAGV